MAPLNHNIKKNLKGFRLSLYPIMATDFDNIFMPILFCRNLKKKKKFQIKGGVFDLWNSKYFVTFELPIYRNVKKSMFYITEGRVFDSINSRHVLHS